MHSTLFFCSHNLRLFIISLKHQTAEFRVRVSTCYLITKLFGHGYIIYINASNSNNNNFTRATHELFL